MDSPDKKQTDTQNQEVPELAKEMQGLSLEEQKTLDKDQNEKETSHKNSENQDSPNADSKSSQDKATPQEKKLEKTAKNSPNLFFYQNKITSKPNGTYIQTMHTKWWGDYDELEDNHSYIQWLFPNFYRSDFNISASALEKHEAIEFRNDPEIAQRLVKSYELILDFYGMKLTDKNTGDLARTDKYQKRYKDALLTYFHNHLRIRRILTHLNNVGFRRYAIKLVDFLEKEIYGEVGGYQKFTKSDETFNVKAFDQAPLKKLSKMTKVFPTWALYGNHYDDPERIKLLEQNCFAKYPEDFQASVFFRNVHG